MHFLSFLLLIESKNFQIFNFSDNFEKVIDKRKLNLVIRTYQQNTKTDH